MKKNLLTALLFSTSLIYVQTLKANPASTDYVNQRVNDAVSTLNASLQKEVNALVTQINAQRIKTHRVGERYQGGIIFYVDESGLHGLISSLEDAPGGEGIQWQNGDSGEKTVNARANGIGAGAANTRLIIAQQTIDYQAGSFAALVAANFSASSDGTTPCTQALACYGDWYLPSLYELDLMRKTLAGTNQLQPLPYWSSTEASVTQAWAQHLGTGEHTLLDKSESGARVRAIRAF